MCGITEHTIADIYDYMNQVFLVCPFLFLFFKVTFSSTPFFTIQKNIPIFQHSNREFVLKFSAMEIYNEAVRDLLSGDGNPLRLLDDPVVNNFLD